MAKGERADRKRAEQSPGDGRRRVVIEGVKPCVDCGRFPVKRSVGEEVLVEADVYTDGHDLISCVLLHRMEGENRWHETPMTAHVNDHWSGSFAVTGLGRYEYTLAAWIDHFASWRRDFLKRVKAAQDVSVDRLAGAELVERAAARATGSAAEELRRHAAALRAESRGADAAEAATDERLAALMALHAERPHVAELDRTLGVVVDPERARFSAWYELFPRSCAPEEGRHGTLRDVIRRLDDVAGMGFDVLYLPPIHPIGRRFRKGRNNATEAEAGDVGSPWAIGAQEGGHKSVHPDLGTLEDFDALVRAAAERGIQIALDVAFQCAPDHPYVRDHPEWFKKRPDGSIQYAENPPKKYQDIYPFDFESEDWRGLWEELKSVFLFWIDRGVTIFRVDNPHTKALPFWEWVIGQIKRDHPETIFLSEAFTRPRVMYGLAKRGFTQSYTYFAWRNDKRTLQEYLTEVTQSPVREYFRPNLWPNTPDILNEYLQTGGRGAFMARLILAATMGASYGIYGPPFELCVGTPREPGSEEYLDSEKYQIRRWEPDRGPTLAPLIARVNQIRRANPALQADRRLRFHRVENDALICYSKSTPDLDNVILCVVNLDPHREQWGMVDLDLRELGLGEHESYQVHDLLTDARYTWQGRRNYVGLNPHVVPAHILRVRKRARSERDFEYFL